MQDEVKFLLFFILFLGLMGFAIYKQIKSGKYVSRHQINQDKEYVKEYQRRDQENLKELGRVLESCATLQKMYDETLTNRADKVRIIDFE